MGRTIEVGALFLLRQRLHSELDVQQLADRVLSDVLETRQRDDVALLVKVVR